MKYLHTIPVPEGMTPREAWDEINTVGQLVCQTVEEDGTGGSWAVVEVTEKGDFVHVIPIEEMDTEDEQ